MSQSNSSKKIQHHQRTNYDNVISYAHIPLVPYIQERSDVPYDHASRLLFDEGSEASEPYNKYAHLFKNNLKIIAAMELFRRFEKP